MNRFSSFALTAAVILTGSCMNSKPPVGVLPEPGQLGRLYILNEGLMGMNNSSIDFYDFADGTYVTDAFLAANPDVTLGLGDTGNDIAVYGGKLWAVMNGSGLVEVMDASSMEHIRAIDVPACRDIAFSGSYAYVTSWAGNVSDDGNRTGMVYRIDINSLSITGTVEVGYQPEDIAVLDGKIYVANSGGMTDGYDNRLSIIDEGSFSIERAVEIAVNICDIAPDAFGRLWISSPGDYYSVHSGIYVFDTVSGSVLQPGAEVALQFGAEVATLSGAGSVLQHEAEVAPQFGAGSVLQHEAEVAPLSGAGSVLQHEAEVAPLSGAGSVLQHEAEVAPLSGAGSVLQHEAEVAPLSGAGSVLQHGAEVAPLYGAGSESGEIPNTDPSLISALRCGPGLALSPDPKCSSGSSLSPDPVTGTGHGTRANVILPEWINDIRVSSMYSTGSHLWVLGNENEWNYTTGTGKYCLYTIDCQALTMTRTELSRTGAESITNPYGIWVSSDEKTIAITDAASYTEPGYILFLDANLNFVSSFQTGFLPGHFATLE